MPKDIEKKMEEQSLDQLKQQEVEKLADRLMNFQLARANRAYELKKQKNPAAKKMNFNKDNARKTILNSPVFKDATANMSADELKELAGKDIVAIGKWWDNIRAESAKKFKEEQPVKKEEPQPNVENPQEKQIEKEKKGPESTENLQNEEIEKAKIDKLFGEGAYEESKKVQAEKEKFEKVFGEGTFTPYKEEQAKKEKIDKLFGEGAYEESKKIQAEKKKFEKVFGEGTFTPYKEEQAKKEKIDKLFGKGAYEESKKVQAEKEKFEKVFGEGTFIPHKEEQAKRQKAADAKPVDAMPFANALEEAVLGYHGSALGTGKLQDTVANFLRQHRLLGTDNKATKLSLSAGDLKKSFKGFAQEADALLKKVGKEPNIPRGFLSSVEMAQDVQVLSQMAQRGIDPGSLEGKKMMLAAKIAFGGGRSFTDGKDFLCNSEKFMKTVDLVMKTRSFQNFTKGKTPEEIGKMASRDTEALYQDFNGRLMAGKEKKLETKQKTDEALASKEDLARYEKELQTMGNVKPASMGDAAKLVGRFLPMAKDTKAELEMKSKIKSMDEDGSVSPWPFLSTAGQVLNAGKEIKGVDTRALQQSLTNFIATNTPEEKDPIIHVSENKLTRGLRHASVEATKIQKNLAEKPQLNADDWAALKVANQVHLMSLCNDMKIYPGKEDANRLALAAKIAHGECMLSDNGPGIASDPKRFMNAVEAVSKSPRFNVFADAKTPEEMSQLLNGDDKEICKSFKQMDVSKQKEINAQKKKAMKGAKLDKVADEFSKLGNISKEQGQVMAKQLKELMQGGGSSEEIMKKMINKNPEFKNVLKAQVKNAKEKKQQTPKKLTQEPLKKEKKKEVAVGM